MSQSRNRDQQIADLTVEGWPLADVKALLRHAATLHRLAELACSSEAADRDRVPCPGTKGGRCLCESEMRSATGHSPVPRIDVQADRVGDAVLRIATRNGAGVRLDGDPRGYVVKLRLPSGRHNTWGGSESGYGVG